MTAGEYYSLRPDHLYTNDLDTETKKKCKKWIKLEEKWVKWWDPFIFKDRFEIVEESSGCNSVYYIIIEWR